MNILLTGATGFIGRNLSRTLTEHGHQLYAWVRNINRASSLLGDQVRCFESLETISDKKIDAVINLAGEPIADKRWSDIRKQILRNSRIDITRELGVFIRTLDYQPRVILSGSAIGYYGSQADDVVLDEQSGVVSGFTHQLCSDWEAAASELASDSTRVCLLRTGIVLGEGGGVLKKMLPPFKLGLGGPIGDGQQVMSWIHLNDWIRAALFLLDNDTLSGPFNLVSPNPVNNKIFTNALAKALHRPAFLKVPCTALEVAMGEASELLCKGQHVIPKNLLDSGFQFEFNDIDHALSEIVS